MYAICLQATQTKRGFSVFEAMPVKERNVARFQPQHFEVGNELHVEPAMLSVDTLPRWTRSKRALFATERHSDEMAMALHYEFVRLLSIETAYVDELRDLFAFTRAPFDAFFASALLNSRLRRRWLATSLSFERVQ